MARTIAPVYDPQAIEPKWRDAWTKAGLFRAAEHATKPKFYNLVMFPYPSGPLHMGHFRNYVIGDAFARYKLMRGFNVLNPFGWDAFGLPAENAAIQSGIPPRVSIEGNIAISKHELDIMGVLFDWDREVSTCNDDYYRWTQWLFLKFLEWGIAYNQRSSTASAGAAGRNRRKKNSNSGSSRSRPMRSGCSTTSRSWIDGRSASR